MPLYFTGSFFTSRDMGYGVHFFVVYLIMLWFQSYFCYVHFDFVLPSCNVHAMVILVIEKKSLTLKETCMLGRKTWEKVCSKKDFQYVLGDQTLDFC